MTDIAIPHNEDSRFCTLINKNADGMVVLDSTGVVKFINPAAEKLFGRSAEFLVNEMFGLPINTEKATEINILSKTGELLVAEMLVVETTWDGSPAYIATFRDITERNRLTEELRRTTAALSNLNRELETRVKAEIEKRRRNEQLLIQQAKLAAMGEMIGAIAHQWRQPLNVIGLLVQDIMDAYDFNELTEQYLQDNVNKTVHLITTMSKTLDEFRSFFEPTNSKSPFNIVNVLEDALTLISDELKNNFIAVTYNKTVEEDFYIDGYRNEFIQVLLNIMKNSKDAILCSRMNNLIGKEEGEINIEITNSKGAVTINVKDNGGGIPDDIIDRIFEPYFTTKINNNCTGIGLYMAKMIIERNMNGKLNASTYENCALFTIEFETKQSAK
ncbi:multi-sensor signal transduction histidine kinase [Candidatus Magnetoovum chiemensis]|nr:multi-sensor signal transduction histidine kinase [Candidatus Magnetoovum chiemensis]